MTKLEDYLSQRDFNEYFKRSSVSYEEFVRQNLIASDFEATGVFHIDYFWWTVYALFLAKVFIFAWAGFVPFNASAILFTYLYIALLPVGGMIFAIRNFPKDLVKLEDSPEDTSEENKRSIEVPVKNKPRLGSVLNLLRQECWVRSTANTFNPNV